jgi:hypothetical protein
MLSGHGWAQREARAGAGGELGDDAVGVLVRHQERRVGRIESVERRIDRDAQRVVHQKLGNHLVRGRGGRDSRRKERGETDRNDRSGCETFHLSISSQ